MKYRSSTEGKDIVQKDYRKKIIFSPDDFDEPSHLLPVMGAMNQALVVKRNFPSARIGWGSSALNFTQRLV